LRVATIAVREQRPDRPVDQAGYEGFFFGRPALALEIATRDASRGIELFEVVAGQRQEIDSGLRLLGRNDGCQNRSFPVAGEHGAIGLAGHLSGLEDELAPAPIELNSMDIEHLYFLSWFVGEAKAMSKTARCCREKSA